MFEKNLHDLVRGIRTNKEDEGKYIASCIDEIRNELKQDNMSLKALGAAKLTYLQMLGYDISWASFNLIEVMSSSKFTHKRIGYLAASQSFHDGTEVMMLATNMIRKDLQSSNLYESSVALTGLSCFLSHDLARDLSSDLMTLISSSKPFVRKKAILTMYKVLLKFPDALRPAFPRIKEKLDDPDPGVQCAAVNVICELARKNPQNYISLAPVLFKMLSSSANNWMLIKVIKLFGALMPTEPRLCKKLVEPLTNIIQSTSAVSLLFESINTLVTGLPDHTPSIQLAVQKLRVMLDDNDQNLKYLSLQALTKILTNHPKYVQPLREKIISCLDDKDESIRRRALDLIISMVSRKNLPDVVHKLTEHLIGSDSLPFREDLLTKIVQICSKENYQLVADFQWYITVLVKLTGIEGRTKGKVLGDQLLDVTIRVKTIRGYSTSQMALLLTKTENWLDVSEVLYAASWICGEFNEYLEDKLSVLRSLFSPMALQLPHHIQAVFIQASFKLYGALVRDYEGDELDDEAESLGTFYLEGIAMYMDSSNLEVQERSCCFSQLVKYLQKLQVKGAGVAEEINALFEEDLNPVSVKAQKKVPVPEGLDLDAWIHVSNRKDSVDESDSGPLFGIERPSSRNFAGLPGFGSESVNYSSYSNSPGGGGTVNSTQKYQEMSQGELELAKTERERANSSNPYYLRGSLPNNKISESMSVDDIPVTDLVLGTPLVIKMNDGKKKRKKRKGKKGVVEDEDEAVPMVDVMGVTEMPDGMVESEGEEVVDPDDVHARLNMDLSQPFNEALILNAPKPYNERSPNPHIIKSTDKKVKKKKSKKKAEPDSMNNLLLNHSSSPKTNGNGFKTLKDIAAEAEERSQIEAHTSVKEAMESVDCNGMDDWLSHKPGETAEVKPAKKKKKVPKGGKAKKKKKAASNDIVEDLLNGSPEPLSATPLYTDLVSNDSLTAQYQLIQPASDTFNVSFKFSNTSTGKINNVKLNISNSMSIKLSNGVNGSISVPGSLDGTLEMEHLVNFTTSSIYTSQLVKGSVTYYIIRSPTDLIEKILNFTLSFPVSMYVVPTPCTSANFMRIIGGGNLHGVDGIVLPSSDFDIAAKTICSKLNLCVVEQVGESVSLFGKTTSDDALCLLVKQVSAGVHVAVKSTSQQLAGNTADLLRAIKL